MNRHTFFSLFAVSLLVVLCHSCGSSGNPKKKVAIEIAHNSCDFASQITSEFFDGALGGALSELTDGKINEVNTNGMGSIPGYWCECYTYYISKDLAEKFTVQELREIKRSKLKTLSVLSKLLPIHKDEIVNCIAFTTDEKIKNYADFERKLNRKIKNQ